MRLDEGTLGAEPAAPERTPDVVVGEVSATTSLAVKRIISSTAESGVLKPEERKPEYVIIRAVIGGSREPR